MLCLGIFHTKEGPDCQPRSPGVRKGHHSTEDIWSAIPKGEESDAMERNVKEGLARLA